MYESCGTKMQRLAAHREMVPEPPSQRPARARRRELLPTPLSPETSMDSPLRSARDRFETSRPSPTGARSVKAVSSRHTSRDPSTSISRSVIDASSGDPFSQSFSAPALDALAVARFARSMACLSCCTRVACAPRFAMVPICATSVVMAAKSNPNSMFVWAISPNSISPRRYFGPITRVGTSPPKMTTTFWAPMNATKTLMRR
mmetsp:Transcript_42229/g.111649  ORF Transcript_42229/g.111649 Transcript_42229/m.111649 type:complete len:203 (-) Transcript_42229:1126-1734(-)